MSDTKRTILAGLLIGLLTLCIPLYLNLIGVMPEGGSSEVFTESLLNNEAAQSTENVVSNIDIITKQADPIKVDEKQVYFSVVSNQYSATVSNAAGGSLVKYKMTGTKNDNYKYVGGYNDFGEYVETENLDLALPLENSCSPCLSIQDNHVDGLFEIVSPSIYSGQTFNLYDSDSLVVVSRGFFESSPITKKTTFFANSYIIKHEYNAPGVFDGPFVVVWDSGIRSTEKNLVEEITYSQAYIGQSKEIKDISLSPSSLEDKVEKQFFSGKTDWVAIRNKYFINSLISDNAVGGVLSARSFQLNENNFIPLYSTGLQFNTSIISVSQLFGPLDVDIVSSSGTYLDRVMNFGWLPIQPFSRSVLWLLKKLHLLGLNYGIILILFAFIIRIITGPLTKKSHQSTQKMQTIQPKIKKIQEKHKNDSQRLNREMMNLYKESGVNPLGGCLPMLIQMPLLFSLFIVFRSTIEFRGAPFFWWMNNLSQPDTIFNLPFNVPIYGNQVAFLPFILGISMFMTQRLSMATMDKSQKPMMYMMSAFFFLLFNSFPSGLNLYYTVYNFLNYFQQKSIKTK